MTKYNGSFATFWWLRIFKEELASLLSSSTCLKQTDARFEDCAIFWAKRMPEIV